MERFAVTHEAQCLTVVFASTLAHVDAAVRTLMAFAQQQQIPCSLFDLELVLREGLTNAAEHGNHLDPPLQVQCVMQAGPKVLQITIADEGEGFDWWQPSHAPTLDSPGGRGVWLMRLYGFQVTYNPAGNVLFLRKNFDHSTEGDLR